VTDTFSDDHFLDGRLLLRQPVKGHRIGTDAMLLAAITPAMERICDLGAGVGAVGLALAMRGSKDVVLVERHPIFVACANHNIIAGGFEEQVTLAEADVFDRKAFLANDRLADQGFDAVATNPPFDQGLRGRRTPSDLKRAAHAMQGGGLGEWLKAAARLLRNGGVLTMIHRADRLSDILAAVPPRLGGLTIRPVQPTEQEAATRLLILATAGSRANLALLPPFILHGSDGGFTSAARQIHEGRATLSMRPGPQLLPN
jgi:tRNA1(Val) A37 N6-methylase TrmN6